MRKRAIKLYHNNAVIVPTSLQLDDDGHIVGAKYKKPNGEIDDVLFWDDKFIMMGTGITDEQGEEICENHIISLKEKHNDDFDIIRYAKIEYDNDEGAFKLCMYIFRDRYSKIHEKYFWESGDINIENLDYWKDFHEGDGINIIGHSLDHEHLLDTFKLIYRGTGDNILKGNGNV